MKHEGKYWISQEDGMIYMPGDQPNPYDDSLIEIDEKEALVKLRKRLRGSIQNKHVRLSKVVTRLKEICKHENYKFKDTDGLIDPFYECNDCGTWWD